MYQTDRFGTIIMAIAMVFALPASIIGFLIGNGLITIMFAFIAGFCLCYILTHFMGPIQQKSRQSDPRFSDHPKPPGIMHQQARGKSRRSRYSGPPFRAR